MAVKKAQMMPTFNYEGIDRKIPDPERGKVLEEMSSLTWVYTVILES